MSKHFYLLLASLLLAHTASAINVAVSIKPLHSIASFISEGAFEPSLLINQNASAHHYKMKPSDRLLIAKADIIYWISEDVETAFLHVLYEHNKSVSFINNTHIIKLPLRENDHHEHGHHHEHESSVDPHIWLSLENAITIAKTMSEQFSQVDVDNAAIYSANFFAFKKKIAALKAQITERLGKVHSKPYASLHDAFQYFEKEFELQAVTNISIHPQLPLSGKQRVLISNTIKEQSIHCVLYDPAHHPKAAQQLAQQENIVLQKLDPLGLTLAKGKDLYFDLLSKMATDIATCLSKG